MQPFRRLTATACPLPLANVDTDQLIPARFMKRPRTEGYGQFLLHDLRRREDGTAIGDFPLERPEAAGARILVARRNFGAGSSREAAVYALVDFGIACVIAPSFGDIFSANAVNNGLLPARISEAEAEALITMLGRGGTVTVDLETCTIVAADLTLPFAIDPVWRTKLLNGWDDIDLTRSETARIEAFVATDRVARPWAQPRR